MVKLDFSKLDGLVTAVAQDWQTGEILMVAYMNPESWELTQKTGIMHYWSRSRGKLWKKGESSGNVQEVKELRIDCDADCVLAKVRQIGDAACHRLPKLLPQGGRGRVRARGWRAGVRSRKGVRGEEMKERIIKLGVPKGSLERATIELFQKAGL